MIVHVRIFFLVYDYKRLYTHNQEMILKKNFPFCFVLSLYRSLLLHYICMAVQGLKLLYQEMNSRSDIILPNNKFWQLMTCYKFLLHSLLLLGMHEVTSLLHSLSVTLLHTRQSIDKTY